MGGGGGVGDKAAFQRVRCLTAHKSPRASLLYCRRRLRPQSKEAVNNLIAIHINLLHVRHILFL